MPKRRAMLASLLAMPALAQGWQPDRPIRLVVPFAPGGNADVVGRLVAQGLQARLGQPVVVENRAGAGGSVGAEAVARARPDGSTLMVGSNGPLTVNPALQARLPYDAAVDFVPIGMAMRVPLVLAAGAQQPWRDAAAMLGAARAQPGAVGLGSSGQGSTTHLAIAALNAAAGVEFLHVPYRSGGAILPDLVAGTVQGAMTEISIPLALAREGRIRLLAVTAPVRSAVAPEVPTMAEAGLPPIHMASFVGLWRRLPRPCRCCARSRTRWPPPSPTPRCVRASWRWAARVPMPGSRAVPASRPSCAPRRRRCARLRGRRAWPRADGFVIVTRPSRGFRRGDTRAA